MKISYSITVCSEREEIEKLISLLLTYKRDEDEIVILFDDKNGTSEVLNYLMSLDTKINLFVRPFPGNFSEWKNTLIDLCSGDWLVNLDADEYLSEELINSLHDYIQKMDDTGIDGAYLSRINTVEGITPNHIIKWGWVLDDKGWINFPDRQLRIFKNDPKIRWVGKVHEHLEGLRVIARFPEHPEYCINHHKKIEKQEQQNELYSKI